VPSKLVAASVFLIAYTLLITRKGRPPIVVWTERPYSLPSRSLLRSGAGEPESHVFGIIIGTMVLSDLFMTPMFLPTLHL
jgi:hypothetical protein